MKLSWAGCNDINSNISKNVLKLNFPTFILLSSRKSVRHKNLAHVHVDSVSDSPCVVEAELSLPATDVPTAPLVTHQGQI